MRHIAIYVESLDQAKITQPNARPGALGGRLMPLPVVWYKDTSTGPDDGAAGLAEASGGIDRGDVATVACWRLDRLGRTARGLTALFADLQQRNVDLVSLREGIDLSTPAGRMLANMLASSRSSKRMPRGKDPRRTIGRRGPQESAGAGRRPVGGSRSTPSKSQRSNE